MTVLVRFTWGSNTVYLCRYTEDLTFGTVTYTATPSLQVTMQRLQGGLEDDEVEISARGSISPFSTLARPFRHARVNVTVYEAVPGEEDTFREVYYGHVTKATQNPQGKYAVVLLRVSGIRARLSPPEGSPPGLGFPALSTCVWRFGDKNCKVDAESLALTGKEITELGTDNYMTRITVDLGVDPAPNSEFNRGYVEVDGLSIMIRQSLEDGRFDLASPPPPEWDGVTTAIIRPGCDKQKTTCSGTWDNLSEFGGCGIVMPAYNPVYEDGTGSE